MTSIMQMKAQVILGLCDLASATAIPANASSNKSDVL
jgi:hypothetical protein